MRAAPAGLIGHAPRRVQADSKDGPFETKNATAVHGVESHCVAAKRQIRYR
jgi:hypothetical protein